MYFLLQINVSLSHHNWLLTISTLTVYGSHCNVLYSTHVSTWKLIWSHCLRNRNEYKCVFIYFVLFCFCSLSPAFLFLPSNFSFSFFFFLSLYLLFYLFISMWAHHLVPPRLIMFYGHKNSNMMKKKILGCSRACARARTYTYDSTSKRVNTQY